MNILVVDDDKALVNLLKFFLEEKGHRVDTAFDGEQAVELLKSNTYELIFSDHNMPKFTGIELVKLVKAQYPGTKIVLLSGYENMKDFFAKSLGADEYLEKPVTAKMIETIVDKHERGLGEKKDSM